MKNEVSVFKVILLFIINIFLFSVFYMIGYNKKPPCCEQGGRPYSERASNLGLNCIISE